MEIAVQVASLSPPMLAPASVPLDEDNDDDDDDDDDAGPSVPRLSMKRTMVMSILL